MQNVASRKPREKLRARRAVGDLTAGEHEGERTKLCIGQGVDFGGASAARAIDGLIFLPPLPPLAERCAVALRRGPPFQN